MSVNGIDRAENTIRLRFKKSGIPPTSASGNLHLEINRVGGEHLPAEGASDGNGYEYRCIECSRTLWRGKMEAILSHSGTSRNHRTPPTNKGLNQSIHQSLKLAKVKSIT